MNWHRIARRLRAKYRRELALERARTEATREALRMMIQELANAMQGEILFDETDGGDASN